jgi:hypothetical protein
MGFRIFCASVVAMLGLGCTQTGLTKPKRSATEQLLLSTAADRALAQADFSIVRGKKVFVERSVYSSFDEDYVIGTLRDFVSSNGGLLTGTADEADLILEPRSGALSIDAINSVIGIPSSAAVPVPLSGSVQLPELALYKSEKHFSIAKLSILIYERESRQHIASTGPLVGRANIKYYKFLGLLAYTKTTVPERQEHKKAEDQERR